jgi:hypothetical protein
MSCLWLCVIRHGPALYSSFGIFSNLLYVKTKMSPYNDFVKAHWNDVQGSAQEKMKKLGAKWQAQKGQGGKRGGSVPKHRNMSPTIVAVAEPDEPLHRAPHPTGLRGGGSKRRHGGSLMTAASVDPLGPSNGIVGFGCTSCEMHGDGFFGDVADFGKAYIGGIFGGGVPDDEMVGGASLNDVGRAVGGLAGGVGKATASLLSGNPLGALSSIGSSIGSIFDLF